MGATGADGVSSGLVALPGVCKERGWLMGHARGWGMERGGLSRSGQGFTMGSLRNLAYAPVPGVQPGLLAGAQGKCQKGPENMEMSSGQ